MHGSNGSGKTTFVQDCFKAKRFDLPHIYIDAIEFYSEKLISICISQHLHGILQTKAAELKLPRLLVRKLAFRVCKTFSALLDALISLQSQLEELMSKASQHPRISMLTDLYFYVVIDNVKSLLKIERNKKIIEKLCITSSLINSPSLFSVVVINDSLTDEIQVFKEHTNVFQEYMFTSFYFSPVNEMQLRAILWETMTQAYGG